MGGSTRQWLAQGVTVSWPALLLPGPGAAAETTLNMPRGVTPISQDLYDLHMTIMAVCAVIAGIVYGVLI